jgi:hypothetical protein
MNKPLEINTYTGAELYDIYPDLALALENVARQIRKTSRAQEPQVTEPETQSSGQRFKLWAVGLVHLLGIG